jgi:branched-chain amino acid transport system substrate-binding protein
MKLRILMLLLLAVALDGCGPKDDATIRIGCLTPLTGEGATYGRSTKQGVDFAVSEINKSGYLSKPLEVIFEDDRIDPKVGVNAIQKLINVNKVPVIIGPFGSSVVLACAPIANQNSTIIISASATADNIADAGDFVFRITPPNSKQGHDIADFCKAKLNAKRAAIIFQNNDYGVTLRDAFQKRFSEIGGSVVSMEGMDGGASDARSQLTKIRDTNSDIVFFPVHQTEAAIVLKQARELGVVAKFISADGAMTPELIQNAGEAAVGSYYSTLGLGYGVADDKIAAFEKAFAEAHGGEKPGVYTAYYYEVTKIIAQAIKEAGYDGKKIRDYLYSLNGSKAYQGITGTTSFDVKGEVDKPFYIYSVQNGQYIRVEQ